MLIYTKEGQNSAILAVREFQRAALTLQLGSDWTEARFGMFFAGVDAHDDNASPPNETLTVADVSDYLTIGLKDAGSYALPGEADALFVGVRSTGATAEVDAPGSGIGFFSGTGEQCSAVGYAGATLINAGVIANGSLRFPDPSPTTGFNGFYALKFVVNSRGNANQAVTISVARNESVAGLDYGKAALFQAIRNSTFGTSRTVAWNTGVAARTLPDAAYIRIPFYNARIRIQEIMAVKIAPVT